MTYTFFTFFTKITKIVIFTFFSHFSKNCKKVVKFEKFHFFSKNTFFVIRDVIFKNYNFESCNSHFHFCTSLIDLLETWMLFAIVNLPSIETIRLHSHSHYTFGVLTRLQLRLKLSTHIRKYAFPPAHSYTLHAVLYDMCSSRRMSTLLLMRSSFLAPEHKSVFNSRRNLLGQVSRFRRCEIILDRSRVRHFACHRDDGMRRSFQLYIEHGSMHVFPSIRSRKCRFLTR